MSHKNDMQSRIDELERSLDKIRRTDFSPSAIWQERVEKLLTAIVVHIKREHDDCIRTGKEHEKAEAEYYAFVDDNYGGDL